MWNLKVLAFFSLSGFGFGLLTVVGGLKVSNYLIWVGAGAPFCIGLALPVALARAKHWIRLSSSVSRAANSAILIVGTYPLAFLSMIFAANAYSDLYRYFAPERWLERQHAGQYVSTMEGFLVGMAIAALLSAGLVSAALWHFTGWCRKKNIVLMSLAGVATIPLSGLLAEMLDVSNAHLMIYPVGGAMFNAVSCLWMLEERYELPPA